MNKKQEKSRGEKFANKIPTSIFSEVVSDNPFVANECRLYGYELGELSQLNSFLGNIYLAFTGEVPTKDDLEKFNFLLNLGLSIGSRYPASRASMNAGVSKTKIEHLLPISLSVASGTHNGSAEVGLSLQFQLNSYELPVNKVINYESLDKKNIVENEGRVKPGFGLVFGDVDPHVAKLAKIYAMTYEPGKYFNWSKQFVDSSDNQFGWLLSGLFAAISLDLGFDKKTAIVLFQIAISPLLAAFGIEKSGQVLTSMPFISDEDYQIG